MTITIAATDLHHIPDQGGIDLPYENWLDHETGEYLGADCDGVEIGVNGEPLTEGHRYEIR